MRIATSVCALVRNDGGRETTTRIFVPRPPSLRGAERRGNPYFRSFYDCLSLTATLSPYGVA